MLRYLWIAFVSLAPGLLAQETPSPVADVRPVLRAMPVNPTPPNPQAAPEAFNAAEISSPLDEKPTGDDAVRLQIFLDQAMFGPGVIDGKPGRFTLEAVKSWNEVNGHP